jgi:hypothetical protein
LSKGELIINFSYILASPAGYAKNRERIFSARTKTQLSPLGIIKIKKRSNIKPY